MRGCSVCAAWSSSERHLVERDRPAQTANPAQTDNYQEFSRPGTFYLLSPAAICRKLVISRNGGAPKKRLYSRLNWEALS